MTRGGKVCAFLIFALDRGEWSVSRSGRFYSSERYSYAYCKVSQRIEIGTRE